MTSRVSCLATTGLCLAIAGCAGTPRGPAASEAHQRDRSAILAMAGSYRVTFDFEESVALAAGYTRHEPYHAEATEFVEVVEDAGDHIVLQHILVLGDEHRVVKHWRQDWRYEDAEVLQFVGDRTWRKVRLPRGEVRGTWTQAVYQVDDSPRYESYGRWQHDDNLSAWTSHPTWRPLPRREYTQRDDYDVLVATNRHTITPDGWVHEQDNYKLVLGAGADRSILAREIGLNRYLRIDDYDFSAGREYWSETRAFWAAVRAEWEALWRSRESVSLRAEVDGDPLWTHMFAMAERSGEGDLPEAQHREQIHGTLRRFLAAPADRNPGY